MKLQMSNIESKLTERIRKNFREWGIELSSASVGRHLHRMMKDNEKFIGRVNRLMKDYVPSESDVLKIIEMNDGLLKRFRMVYDAAVDMKRKLDEELNNVDCRFSGYNIHIEYFFG